MRFPLPFRPRSIVLALSLAAALAAFGQAAEEPKAFHSDVVVYGGTPSGLIAAVAAAREGASVTVIESTAWIGGMVTGGLSSTDTGKQETIGGYTREFFVRAAARYNGQHLWFAEPHANMETFEAMLKEAKVTVITKGRLKEVERKGARIASLTLDDQRRFEAEEFIDASYEGDLMAAAKVQFAVGREAQSQYGETLAGYHPMPIRPRTVEVMESECPSLGGKGPGYIHGTPASISGLDAQGKPIPGVCPTPHLQPGEADNLTQAYNFRLCVTRDPANRLPFPKPAAYDPTRYELLLRLIQAFPKIPLGRLFYFGELANGKYDLNAQGLFSTDLPGANTAYPNGDAATRQAIWQDHIAYTQGLLWFLSHDERIPEPLRTETNAWGLCRDEFADNGGWPYALYVREARRMVGSSVLTQKDLQTEITKPDSVGMGSFVIDCHIVERILAEDGTVRDEGSFQDAPVKPYQIPYRSLTPRREECENLLVPVCLSASHIACCSLRMEPVYMALGHASGVAATMALKSHTAVQSIDISALQARLRAQGAVLDLPQKPRPHLDGIVQESDAATYTGAWTETTFGNCLGDSSRHDANEGKGTKEARFQIKVPAPGRYEIRFAYVAAANRSGKVPISIVHAKGTTEATVNEQAAPNLDGHFISLGEFDFDPATPGSLTVRTAGTEGFVSVDAVQIRPLTPQ